MPKKSVKNLGPKPVAKKGRTLQDFRAVYDNDFIIPNKIKQALNALGDSWETELDFTKRAGISISQLHLYKEAFEDHIIPVQNNKKRIWAGTKAFATKCKELV